MKRVLLVALGATLLAMVGAPEAHATVKGVGWWSDSPTASAPSGGVAIGAAPGGPTAVAAVLLDLGEGASRAALTLTQSGGAAPAGGSIVACVTGTFTPAEKGPMADAPATACEGTSTPLTMGADGVTWTVDVSDLVGNSQGTVGIALVPGAGASLFDLQFDTVKGQVTPAAGGAGPTSSPTFAPRPATSSSPSSSPAPSSSSPRPASSSFTAPSAPSFAAPATTTTVPSSDAASAATDAAESAATEVAAGGSVALPTAASTGADSEPSGGAGQALGYVVLAAIIGVVGGVGHRVASRRLAI